MHYGLIIIAALLFSTQFLFNQRFQQETGNTWSAARTFTIYTSATGFVIFFALNGFRLEFSWFSLGVASALATVNILYSFASIKAFDIANLAVYSVFAMLGGMLLPFAYGVIFAEEPLTGTKLACCLLIAIALFLTCSSVKGASKGIIFYVAVFVLNGLCGVLSKIHQSHTMCVDSESFIAISRAVALIVCLTWQFVSERRIVLIRRGLIKYTVGYAVFCGIGNLLTLISLNHLPASIQYPIITGGTMVFSTLISLLRRERLTWRDAASAVIAFTASIVIAL